MTSFELVTPAGNAWDVDDVPAKLKLRAGLPGAYMYDTCVRALAQSRALGVSTATELTLALAQSWLVNSPATSFTMRAWHEPARFAHWVALVDALRRDETQTTTITSALDGLWGGLGTEHRLETLSKVLASLCPEVVPHMTTHTTSFILGERAEDEPATFVAFASYWRSAVDAARGAIEPAAMGDAATGLGVGAILDRLLWFDVVGHAHFA